MPASEATRLKLLLKTQKGVISWETRAERKIKKRVRSKTLQNRSISHKTSRISSPKESPDGTKKGKKASARKSVNPTQREAG